MRLRSSGRKEQRDPTALPCGSDLIRCDPHFSYSLSKVKRRLIARALLIRVAMIL
ncbi:hypothetical protein NGA_0718000, partial [Nannochloropsis gaditana CCMP526]|uniref:uncharacterized protein n=1 Tax=Nannochloropsis gaditana (strain CCMP526) TaxID=1093141 RepID=UPI00029F63BA